MKKHMKMKLLDYTLIGLLSGMAPAAMAQTAGNSPAAAGSQAAQDRADGTATIRVRPFRRLEPTSRDALAGEAERVLDLVAPGSEPTVSVERPGGR